MRKMLLAFIFLAGYVMTSQAKEFEISMGYQRIQRHGLTRERPEEKSHHIGDRFTVDSATILFRHFPPQASLSGFGVELTTMERISGGLLYRFLPRGRLIPEASLGISEAGIHIVSNEDEINARGYAAFVGIGLSYRLTKALLVNASYKYTERVNAVGYAGASASWNERYSFIGLIHKF